MKTTILFFLAALSLFAADRADVKITLTPFRKTTEANALIIRTRLAKGRNYLGPVSATLQDGDTVLKQTLEPVDWMYGCSETDFEFTLKKVTRFSPQTRLELVFKPSSSGCPKVYAVLPAVFNTHDLSQGLDHESASNRGVWLGHGSGRVSLDGKRGLSGKYCTKAVWPTGGAMISLLPGERDWRPYAALRFTIANPLPGAEGRRQRVMFLYDGKTVQRPHVRDSISLGSLTVLQEGVKTFTLDLKLFAKNNPKFNLGNVKSFQIFWSSFSCGPTTFYIDDVKLLTQKQIDSEIHARYRGRINALKKSCNSDNRALSQVIADLEKRYAAGERETLTPLFERANELKVIQQLAIPQEQSFRILGADAAFKVMRDAMPEYTSFPMQISAAGNERESFQLVIAPSRELKKCVVRSSALTDGKGASIPADAVSVNPVGYIEVRSNAYSYKTARPGMWPDILLENEAFDLPVRLQPYMITVAVPAGQKPGIYHGTLTVTADNAGPQKVEYTVKVYGFSLPVRGELVTHFTFQYLPKNRKIRRKAYDTCFSYRLNPTGTYSRLYKDPLPGCPASTFVPPLEDIPYCLERGMNFMTFGDLLDRPARDPNTFDEAYIKAAIAWTKKMKPELQKLGAWDIACLTGFDEIMHAGGNVTQHRLAEARKLCSALKKAVPDVKIYNAGRLMTIDNSLMDYWFIVPDLHKVFAGVQRRGGFVGFYWAYQDPSFMLDQPGIAPRLCSWLAYKEGASGISYYSTFRPHETLVKKTQKKVHTKRESYCTEDCLPQELPHGLDWKRDVYKMEGIPGRNGDGVLFHPAPDGSLLGSQRLVNIRDGIEDYEYFKLLEKIPGADRKLLTVGNDIITVTNGDYTTDIRKVKRQRDAVASAIEAGLKKQAANH